VEVFTIGFTKRKAAEFFGALRSAGVRRVVDVRLSNTSQLAGFTKKDDLPFFLRELCGAEYLHQPILAPTHEIRDNWLKHRGRWEDYERDYMALLEERKIEGQLDRDLFTGPTALLCAEPTPEHCHRRLVLEYLQRHWGNIKVVHI